MSQNLQQHINMTSRAICSVTFYHLAPRHQQSCQFFVIKQTFRLFILKECQKSTNCVRLGQSRDHSDLSIMKCKHCMCRSEFCCEFFAGFTKLASLAWQTRYKITVEEKQRSSHQQQPATKIGCLAGWLQLVRSDRAGETLKKIIVLWTHFYQGGRDSKCNLLIEVGNLCLWLTWHWIGCLL